MKLAQLIEAKIAAAKADVKNAEEVVTVDWDDFKVGLAADKAAMESEISYLKSAAGKAEADFTAMKSQYASAVAYLTSRLSFIETHLSIVAPPPPPPAS